MTRPLVKVATLVAAASAAATPAAEARAMVVEPVQPLVEVLSPHAVRSSPRADASRTGTLRASRPITGGRTVVPVLRRTTTGGARWLQIRVPGRPNGRKGWIVRRGTRLTRTTWHLVVRTASRRLSVYRHGDRVRSFAAVVGKPSTPTPRGRFFVEESVLMPAGSAGAPFALALSARSNVLQEFAGGPGQIAIHGVANLRGEPGTAVSHGCIRLTKANISWLAARIAAGVPVTIV